VLFSAKFEIPWDLPGYHQHLAWFAARSIAQGEFPSWDPYTYCGLPGYANLNMQIFYPPTLLVITLSSAMRGRHVLYLLEWQIVLHVLAGGVFTLLLLRKLGLSTAAALAGATVYQLGPYFASHAQHLGAMDTAAWLPLAWLAVLELAEGWKRRWLAVLATALALSFLAGFPAAAVVVWASTFVLAALLVAVKRSDWLLLPRCAAGVGLALMLCAVQLISTIELNRWSVSDLRSDWADGGGGGMALAALWSLVWPDSFGVLHFTDGHWHLPWNATFMYIYCGIPTLVLAAVAIWRRHPLTLVFGCMVVISVAWMLGDSTPVYTVLVRWLPGTIRGALYSEFALCAFTLSLAVLAGIGAHEWLKYKSRKTQILMLMIIAADLIYFSSARPFNTANSDRDPVIGYDNFDGYPEVAHRVRALVNADTPPWRIDTMNASPNWASNPSLLEVPTANGNEPFALRRFMEVRRIFTGGEPWGRYYDVRDPNSPLLGLLNVRYVISREPLSAPGRLLQREMLPGNVVYQNPDPSPRFFLVEKVVPAAGMEEASRILRSPKFDPRIEAVVEGTLAHSGLGKGSVRIVQYRAHEVALDVESDAPGFLVSSEAYYPGWKASVDNRPVELALTNVAFRGVWIPAGRHRVKMWFVPETLQWAGVISVFGLIVLSAMAREASFPFWLILHNSRTCRK
jgi:hypothetical protein